MFPSLLLLLLLLTHTVAQNLVGEDCTLPDSCLKPRFCATSTADGEIPCTGATPCFCTWPDPITGICSTTANCVPGEICAKSPSLLDPICISRDFVLREGSEFHPVEPTPESSLPPGPALAGEECSLVKLCLSPRFCAASSDGVEVPCDGVASCFCSWPDLTTGSCTSSGDCVPGELCAKSVSLINPICLSRSFVLREDSEFVPVDAGAVETDGELESSDVPEISDSPMTDVETQADGTPETSLTPFPTTTPEPIGLPEKTDKPEKIVKPEKNRRPEKTGRPERSATPEISGTPETSGTSEVSATPVTTTDETTEVEPGVCIGVESLEHLRDEELVFSSHRVARMLCDESGSCATGGHMVLWKGEAMMMKRYCGMVGCEEKIGMVNSPKWRRGLVVESKSEDLVFLAFAARFESLVEERVLVAVVRAGF